MDWKLIFLFLLGRSVQTCIQYSSSATPTATWLCLLILLYICLYVFILFVYLFILSVYSPYTCVVTNSSLFANVDCVLYLHMIVQTRVPHHCVKFSAVFLPFCSSAEFRLEERQSHWKIDHSAGKWVLDNIALVDCCMTCTVHLKQTAFQTFTRE